MKTLVRGKENMKTISYKPILVAIVGLQLMFAIGYATEGKKAPPTEPAQGEEINWQVISSGGTRSTSASFMLSGTVGQTAVGYGSSANYGLSHGFWQSFVSGACCIPPMRGDVNYSGGNPNVADLTYLVDFLFRGGPPPPCTEEGNVNGDPNENINIADLTYLVDYLFRGGTMPPACP